MNVLIISDLEGIAGVTDIEFVDMTNEKYKRGCRLLEHSINLTVDAALSAGASTVYYLDGHAGGSNVRTEAIDPRAKACTVDGWHELLQAGELDAIIELGAHARAGTVGGFLDHTNSSREWFAHRVNGVEMSELSLHALLCSAYGVPTVACIGDEAACRQAQEYIPEIATGAVKHAARRNLATDYENADEILTDAVRLGISGIKEIPLYRTAMPATVELTYYRTDMCESALDNCTDEVTRVDARTLRKTVQKITRYADLKF